MQTWWAANSIKYGYILAISKVFLLFLFLKDNILLVFQGLQHNIGP